MRSVLVTPTRTPHLVTLLRKEQGPVADSHSTTIWQTMTVQTAVRDASVAYGQHVAQQHELFLQTMGPSARLESPIEAVFWVWWNTLEATEQGGNGFPFSLDPQHDVECEGFRYRLDFAIPEALVAIELDGHDFHERTKEQVARRNTRDRHLQAAAWTVLHFSGSEMVRDPISVIAAVVKVATARVVK